jgi:hypothetical protein
VNNTKKINWFHLALILLLIFSNVLMFSLMVSTERKNQELEQQLQAKGEYASDLWYSLQQ